MKNRMVWCVILLAILGGRALAGKAAISPFTTQNQQNVERVFQQAVEHYKSGRYDVVEYELQSLVELFPENSRITAILYLQARAQFQQNKLGAAMATLDRLLTQFPNSRYRDEALFLQSAITFKRQDYLAATHILMQLLRDGKDPRVLARTRKVLPLILTDYLTAQQVSDLLSEVPGVQLKPMLQYASAVHLFRSGKFEQAKRLFEALVSTSSDTSLQHKIQGYLGLIERKSGEGIKIGLILPLSGYLAEEAKSVLQGLQFALQNSQTARKLNVQFEVRDSRGDVLETIEATRQLLSDPKVVAIVGEIESDKTAIICALTENEGLPVFSPTAALAGLTEKFQNLVQLTPDISIRGAEIARYAMHQMGLQNFAILAPADPYGKDITDSFAQTVDQNNGTILAETWYYQGATELRNQFSHIREIGFQKMMRDSVLSEMPGLSLAQVDSVVLEILREREQKRLEQGKTVRMKFADSTAIPVTSIDAVFLPVYTDEIDYVAPQFALFNIQSQLLGGDYWYDEEVLDRNRRYVEGVVFTSDYYEDQSDLRFIRFRDTFRGKIGVTPGKMAILGYDCANLLFSILGNGANTRQEVLRQLNDLETFEGLLHPYDFRKKRRVNSYLYILKYEDNTIKRVQ